MGLGYYPRSRPRAGVWYYVYVIPDLYSRYIVRRMVAETENTVLSEQLFSETFARSVLSPDPSAFIGTVKHS